MAFHAEHITSTRQTTPLSRVGGTIIYAPAPFLASDHLWVVLFFILAGKENIPRETLFTYNLAHMVLLKYMLYFLIFC